MKKIIEFKNFSFQYDAQAEPTLKHIDLSIYEGEKILIIGASGSGKSTLGKCLNGIIPQNDQGSFEGTLVINGKQFGEASIYDLSLEVGTVLQDTDSQFVGLTVKEDIAFSLENEAADQTTMRQAVKYWAEQTDIANQLEKRPQELSGGQKQRVTIAGVLIDETPILLFDEPLANLDPQAGYDSVQLIDRLYQSTAFTTIIIEHRLEEVLQAPVDRIILMDEGRIVADLPPDDLLRKGLLKKYGIREPLYLTALKKAGVSLSDLADLTDVSTLVSPEINSALINTFEKQPAVQKTAAKEPLLELKQLTFGYHYNRSIIDQCDLTLYKGEMISLVGHNGAGKTTLSNLITGFYAPDSGDILWKGQSILGDSIKKRAEKIGYVLQNSNQMLSKNQLYDEIALGLRNRQFSEEEIAEKIDRTLKICGLYPFRNWPLSALSHGQKRRVAIASILVLEPEMLILDEPTAGQDYRHYSEMMDFLQELNRHGITILMITHDMHLMLEYTTRTLILKEGRLIADLSPAEALSSQELTKAASLRATSLFNLARNNHVPDAAAFVDSFIKKERQEKTNGE